MAYPFLRKIGVFINARIRRLHSPSPRFSYSSELPENITPVCLPPYAPELNPTENIREYLRKNYLALRVFDDYDAIVDACCMAWNDLLAMPDRLASITRRKWAKVSGGVARLVENWRTGVNS